MTNFCAKTAKREEVNTAYSLTSDLNFHDRRGSWKLEVLLWCGGLFVAENSSLGRKGYCAGGLIIVFPDALPGDRAQGGGTPCWWRYVRAPYAPRAPIG